MGETSGLNNSNRRKLLIVIGVGFVAACFCTFLFYRMVSGRLASDGAGAETARSITVAARALPRGTRLRAEDLETRPYSGGDLPSSAFSDPIAVVGRTLHEEMEAGQSIHAEALAQSSEDWLAMAIPEGMRGITVHIGEFAGVTQHLQVGDRVDVMVSDGNRAPGNNILRLKTLLQNIEVVATGREGAVDGRSNPVPVVTLLVDARDSQDLSLADQSGAIRLALRNPLDGGTQDTRGVRLSDLMNARDDAARNARRQADTEENDGPRAARQSGASVNSGPEVAALIRD